MSASGINIPISATGLVKTKTDLLALGRAGDGVDKTANKLSKSFNIAGKSTMGLHRALIMAGGSFAAFSAVKSALNNITAFEDSMAGLKAVSGATADELGKLEKQARVLGATTVFSASETADAQRFLAMAGFEVNEVLGATESVLQLAIAGNLDLARAADIASNVLGGLRLETSELGRVNNVMAATAAGANTNVEQLGKALSYAAPLATSAGMSLEETAAAIGALSDNGLQGMRAGTGLNGVIRQLSRLTPKAAKVLSKYGLTANDVNIQTEGLANVMLKMGKANLTAAHAIEVFGTEAAPAGLILSATAKQVRDFTGDLNLADDAAASMAETMSDTLSAKFKGFSSAVYESTLQLGKDSGLSDALSDATVNVTGFLSIYNGMSEEFRKSNKISDEHFETLTNGYDVVAAALGGFSNGLETTYEIVASVFKTTAEGISSVVGVKTDIEDVKELVVGTAGAMGLVVGGLIAAKSATIAWGGAMVIVNTITKLNPLIRVGTIVSSAISLIGGASVAAGDNIEDLGKSLKALASGDLSAFGDVQDEIEKNEKRLTEARKAKLAADAKAEVDAKLKAYKDLMAIRKDAEGFLSEQPDRAGLFDSHISSAFALNDQIQKINSSQDEYHRLMNLAAGDEKLQAQLKSKNNQLAIGQYASMASAARGFFDESSSGYAALAGMEKALAAVQLVNSIRVTAAKIFGTKAVVGDAVAGGAVQIATQQAIGASAAVTGVANQAAGDPYTAFARMSTMATVMAGLGFAVGLSGSSGSKARLPETNKGTGTLLGSDDASDSLGGALDSLEGIGNDSLGIANNMLKELRSIDKSINGLGSAVVRTGAGINIDFGKVGQFKDQDLSFLLNNNLTDSLALGLGGVVSDAAHKVWGGKKIKVMQSGLTADNFALGDIDSAFNLEEFTTKKIKKRKAWKRSEKIRTSTSDADEGIEDDFTEVLTGYASAIESSAEILGLTTADIDKFNVSLGLIDFKGLSGDEISEKLSSVFNQQADLMAEFAAGGIEHLQNIGEGYFETITRVAGEATVALNSLSKAGINLDSNVADVTQGLIDASGGFSAFQASNDSFYDAFYTDQEKQGFRLEELTKAFADQNLVLPKTRDAYKDLMGGFDVTTESGQDAYATMLKASGVADDYYSTIEETSNELDKSKFKDLVSFKLAQAMVGAGASVSSVLPQYNTSGIEVPAFAKGGFHHGGLRLVGENGPELEYTAPAHITNASKTSKIMQRISEGFEPKKNHDGAALLAIARNTAKTAKLIDRWDGDGMPVERVS